MSIFFDRLEIALRHAGLNKTELACKIGVQKETISRWRKHRPYPRMIDKLTSLLGVSRAWLENGIGEMVVAATEPQRETIAESNITEAAPRESAAPRAGRSAFDALAAGMNPQELAEAIRFCNEGLEITKPGTQFKIYAAMMATFYAEASRRDDMQLSSHTPTAVMQGDCRCTA